MGLKDQMRKTGEVHGRVDQRMRGIHEHQTMTKGQLSVFLADVRVIAQKILLVLQPEKLAATVESKGILLESAKALRNESLILRTLHTNGMQMDFGT